MTAPMTRKELFHILASAIELGHLGDNWDMLEISEEDHAHLPALLRGDAQDVPSDPLAGLAERLDRLLLTSRDNERFVLSTESAKNIVGIVRVWLRAHSLVPSTSHRCGFCDGPLPCLTHSQPVPSNHPREAGK